MAHKRSDLGNLPTGKDGYTAEPILSFFVNCTNAGITLFLPLPQLFLSFARGLARFLKFCGWGGSKGRAKQHGRDERISKFVSSIYGNLCTVFVSRTRKSQGSTHDEIYPPHPLPENAAADLAGPCDIYDVPGPVC